VVKLLLIEPHELLNTADAGGEHIAQNDVLELRQLGLLARNMGDQISWHVVLAIKQDQLDNFQALTREMVDFTRTEPGVLCYQRFASEDGKFVHGYERYADSAAALAHLRDFATLFSERFSALVDREQFMVFGQPSHELRTVLDRFGAIYLRPFGDLGYW
jgi:quinol monooxygenase YgiN